MSFTIDGKEVIVLGDTTTHGGKVVTASSSFSHLGMPVARVGDMVICPKCKGKYPIVDGAPTATEDFQKIARHGDKVACGATLIAGGGKMSAMGVYRGLTDPQEPIPTKGLSAEEICSKIQDVISSEHVQKAIKEAIEKTKETGYEYAFWIVEGADGTYSIPEIVTSEDKFTVFTPGRPEGRVAHFHTHTDASGYYSFSDFDRDGASDASSHPLVFSIVHTVSLKKGLSFMNDEGNNVICGESGPRICKGSGEKADSKDAVCF